LSLEICDGHSTWICRLRSLRPLTRPDPVPQQTPPHESSSSAGRSQRPNRVRDLSFQTTSKRPPEFNCAILSFIGCGLFSRYIPFSFHYYCPCYTIIALVPTEPSCVCWRTSIRLATT
jgi:hypothetical protein